MQSSHRGLWVVSACFFVVALICSVGLMTTLPKKPAKPLASPFVMVSVGGGHGSGTHLGNGLILTAFHVTDKSKAFKIKTNDGRVFDGELLLESPVADVAIVYVKDYKDIGSAPLSCAPNYVGQPISMVGNPESVEFAKTWGRVSALGITGYEDALEGRWKELVTLDATAAHGVSGAGVVNDAGQVVGILVSGMESAFGPAYPYTFMIPGKAICHALARPA
jgi:serine protease Do